MNIQSVFLPGTSFNVSHHINAYFTHMITKVWINMFRNDLPAVNILSLI